MKALKAFIEPFEAPQRSVKIKISDNFYLKVALSPLKKNSCYFFESTLKMMKNAFYFILKAIFVLKILEFLSWLVHDVGKTASLER